MVVFGCLFQLSNIAVHLLLSPRYQAPPLFQYPSLGGEYSTAFADFQRHYFDNWSLELCHMEGRSHGNNTHHFSYNIISTLLNL